MIYLFLLLIANIYCKCHYIPFFESCSGTLKNITFNMNPRTTFMYKPMNYADNQPGIYYKIYITQINGPIDILIDDKFLAKVNDSVYIINNVRDHVTISITNLISDNLITIFGHEIESPILRYIVDIGIILFIIVIIICLYNIYGEKITSIIDKIKNIYYYHYDNEIISII